MADTGKLYIIITDNPNIQSTQTTITKTKTTTTTKKIKSAANSGDDETLSFITHEFYHYLKQTATEVANWSVGNIGNFTGNYYAQSEITKSISLMNRISGIGSSVATGATMGGVWGAVVAGVIAVAGTVVSVGLQDKANAFAIKRQNYEIAQLRELSGLNPLTNGGRI